MCGIIGFYNFSGSNARVEPEDLRIARDTMLVRGPDGCGLWSANDHNTMLAHRRLSIIDISEEANQPLSIDNGKLKIVFNGEIYNYRKLSESLKKAGISCKTRSDTEVILQMYKKEGVKSFSRLQGMFAFAIYDEYKDIIVVCRDQLGIKPVYIYRTNNFMYFGSQVKSLLACKHVQKIVEPAGHVGFFLWGAVPEPYTLYKDLKPVEPGTYIVFNRNGSQSQTQYYNLLSKYSDVDDKSADMARNFLDSLNDHMVSDVPVSIFQSGGIDSSLISVNVSALTSKKINTVTLLFDEYKETADDESVLAKQVASAINSNHHVSLVTKKDFECELGNIFRNMDQPTIDGVNTYFVAKAASNNGYKVALSGLGSDEIFGGYPAFTDIPKILAFNRKHALMGKFGALIRKFSVPIAKHMTSPKFSGIFEYGQSLRDAYLLRRSLYMPWELYNFLDGELVDEGLNEIFNNYYQEDLSCIDKTYFKISYLEVTKYMRNMLLRDSDWAGMSHSVEIRVPFVYPSLVESTVGSTQKHPLNKVQFADLFKNKLPASILQKKKTGFSVPISTWINSISNNKKERGLRGWSHFVYKEFAK